MPADATVVVIAGPQTDFLPPEIDALKRYRRQGRQGDVHARSAGAGAADRAQPARVPARSGRSSFGNDVVVDASGIGQLFGGDASVPVAASYPAHPITEGFRVMTAFPLARSVKPVEGGAGRTHGAAARARPARKAGRRPTSRAWRPARSSSTPSRATSQGPITLGAAVSAPATEAPPPPAGGNASPDAPKPESRIVAIGDSDFAANNAHRHPGQSGLLPEHGQLAGAAGEPDRDSATRGAGSPHHADRRSAAAHHAAVDCFVIPGLVLAGGVYTWWRRR